MISERNYAYGCAVKGGNNATGLNDNRLLLFQGKGAFMYPTNVVCA